MNQDTKTLAAQAKAGDAHAFALLYETIYKDLYRFAFCTMKTKELAEDVVSEAVLHAFEQMHRLHRPEAFRSWMFQITANECKRQLRLQARTVPLPEEELSPPGYADPSSRLAIQEAFATLKETERIILGLNLVAGYNSREIARLLHTKEGTVRSTKSRALSRLKQFFETDTERPSTNGGKL